MIQLQYYEGGIHSKKPKGKMSLNEMILAIKNPGVNLFDIYKKTRSKDETIKRKAKEKLPFWIPAVRTNGSSRGYADIISFTGLLVLDFDKFDSIEGLGLSSEEVAERFKVMLFERYNCILATWVSASGRGVRALVRIPKVQMVDEYKELFWGIRELFEERYEGFDRAPQNPVLPLFASHDPTILFREWDETALWTVGGENPKKIIPSVKPENISKQIEVYGDKYKQWALDNTKTALDKITDNGHPQLRAAAYALGGHVGAGYLSLNEAENFIHSLIASHSYLSKDVKGYSKTASTMLMQGQGSPIYFNN